MTEPVSTEAVERLVIEAIARLIWLPEGEPLGEAVRGLVAERDALRAEVEFWDYFHDEAFPDDPYLSGSMRGEVERLRAALAEGGSTDA